MAPNRFRHHTSRGRHSASGGGFSLMSCVFMAITVFCLGTSFYLYNTPLDQAAVSSVTTNPAYASEIARKFVAESIEELEYAYLKKLKEMGDAMSSYAEQHGEEEEGSGSDHSSEGSTPSLRIPSKVQHEEQTTTSMAKNEQNKIPKDVTKKIVPLSTPQGYDSENEILTIGRWQASGVTRDPAVDSPAIQQKLGEPAPGLMHKAVPISNKGVVMGLAAYPNDILGKFERFVGTLRGTGYEGHIILGVHPNISPREVKYLQAMNVTYYASDAGPCISPLPQVDSGEEAETNAKKGPSSGTNYIRGTCSKHYDHLVFEWARYEMALGWIKACPECEGWMLVCDVKDTVFQRPPFEDLPQDRAELVNIKPDLYLFEEAFPPPMGFDHNHWFAWGSIKNCFGKEHEHEMMASYRTKPILCSGSTVGTRNGLTRYLSAITRRYYEMTWLGPDCTPPSAVDQPIHNWLFYTEHGYSPSQLRDNQSLKGYHGDMAVSMPLGTGAVATVGRLCAMAEKAKLDLSTVHKMNLTVDEQGLFLNLDGKKAPVVHQHDRCWSIWQPVLTPYCRRAHESLRQIAGDAVRDQGTVCKGG